MGLFSILIWKEPGPIRTWLHSRDPGHWGEYTIEFVLKHHNLKGHYVVLKNLYIPYRGKTSEIDLVLIHERGIFVLESKNYSGSIFGNYNQLYWTQVLGNGTQYQFYNPIRQNQTHIAALSHYLKLDEDEMISYIVFSPHCTLEKIPHSNLNTVILQRQNLLYSLRNRLKHMPICFTRKQIQSMKKMLKPCIKVGKKEKHNHIKQIQTVCPLCGSQLVMRRGRYGDFWGCSAYPSCHFTAPISVVV